MFFTVPSAASNSDSEDEPSSPSTSASSGHARIVLKSGMHCPRCIAEVASAAQLACFARDWPTGVDAELAQEFVPDPRGAPPARPDAVYVFGDSVHCWQARCARIPSLRYDELKRLNKHKKLGVKLTHAVDDYWCHRWPCQ